MKTGIGLVGRAVGAALFLGAFVITPAFAASVSPQDVTGLTNQIVITAQSLPAGSGENAFEAQFAAMLEQAGANCSQFRMAASQATDLPRAAYVALRRLSSTLTSCGTGTAAIGGGRPNQMGVPHFSVGGGTDYVH